MPNGPCRAQGGPNVIQEVATMSLSDAPVWTMLPITDPDRAREFYGERLGLRDDGTDEEGSLVFGAGGGSKIVLRQLPAGEQSKHTALSFEVDDVASEVRELEGRGVEFEDYDTAELRTVDHIFTSERGRAAWFRDPDGNVLCLHQVIEG
jgi:catechol 2,3-dioxygenase-like lactoylglutathione lyase family enzyme